jgi:PAS domain S-box-containing protein
MSIEEIGLGRGWRLSAVAGRVAALDVPVEFVESLPVAASACDARGRVLWFNGRAAALFGRTPLPGDDLEEFLRSCRFSVNRQEMSRQETPLASVLRTGMPMHEIEVRLERPDGSRIWALANIEATKSETGRGVGAIICLHDTTGLQMAAEASRRRAEEQAALFQFTEQMQYTSATAELYELAMDAITRAMACRRAAVLLFDRALVMRFVAARGLSEAYRCAVDGHSPWSADAADAQPICIDDIERADLAEALKTTVRREGIGALAFIPLKEDGRLIGKFMAYHDAPHAFTTSEIAAGLAIARQLAFGLERKRAEEAMQRLATIVESSDDAIISKNLDGVIQTWNRGAERIFGYEAEEIIGKPVTTLMPPERFDEEPEILARLRAGERIEHYETVRRRKDGTRIDVSLTVSPVRDRAGRIVGASKIARDITEQKRAEAALRDSERRLQDLLAAIPAAIYTTDAAGRITYFNEAAVELAGKRPTIGSDLWCVTWKLYRPDGTLLPHDQCPMAIALKEGRAIRGVEAVAERPDGTRVPFIPFPTPLRDERGNIVGAINMLVDVSERKHAETQQRVLLRELNHRVKNNMQMLQSLLYAATRQTQNPEARKILEDASSRIGAMAAAQRVLYGTTDATRFSTAEFLDSVCQAAQQTFPSNVDILREAASGELDNDVAMPLALILNELLTNAVKYGAARENRIRVGLTFENGDYVLYVEDCGPGFDLQSVRPRSSGLKLVELLARQLRGRFEVTNQPCCRCSLRFSRGPGGGE